jgi:hypothetical protein
VCGQIVGHIDGGGLWALVQHGGLFERYRGMAMVQNYQLRGDPGTSITCDLSAHLRELLRRQPDFRRRALESRYRLLQALLGRL